MATLSVLPGVLPELTPALLDRYAPLYERVRNVIPELEWQTHLPWIDAIQSLKKQRNAVILAHNYQAPEIFHTVSDITGDSLALAQQAARVEAKVLVQCGVHFMAETSKILCPDKTVLIPDTSAGCSLAESITAEDVRLLKARYPGVPVVTYVNTSADVKAESDVCCTSANAVHIVESLGVDRVIFLPDKYLGQYVASKTQVKVILWEGSCEVHERFSGEELRSYRRAHGNVRILAHP
jgi:quinolinate synthase